MKETEGGLLLAIDTSTRFAGVGLDDGSGAVATHVWRSGQNHGAELMPAIMALLEELGCGIGDLTGLAVARGPGGFSALRVGIGTVIGLATPRGLPVAEVSTHEIEAAPFMEMTTDGTPLFSLIPAGRGEVAWARFQYGRLAGSGLSHPLDLAAGAAANSLFCGESAGSLTSEVERSRLVAGLPPTRDPKALLALGRMRLAVHQGGDAPSIQPDYVREPSISRPRPPK